MFRGPPRVNAQESRKQQLIAESELNRVEVLQEWQTMTTGIRGLADRAKAVGAVASAAALFVAGVSAFRRSKPLPAATRPSWYRTLLNGAQLAGSLWLLFRARSKDG